MPMDTGDRRRRRCDLPGQLVQLRARGCRIASLLVPGFGVKGVGRKDVLAALRRFRDVRAR